MRSEILIRALPAFQIEYRMGLETLETLHWLCVYMVAQLHAY